ncbi:peroxiredoxin family protein [Cyclobacterium plantarum]|uniref:peroxiredoxin family protein n=1 Tax=Cyclobacterium plantarum TaxID=2716263 RepID=UPI003F7086EC
MARLFLITGFIWLLISCQSNPEEVLGLAKQKMEDNAYISYSYFSLWPDMIGENDTIAGTSQFKRNKNTYFDYDFISQRDKYDLIYVGDEYKQILHGDSVVIVYTTKDIEKESIRMNELMVTNYSPMMLLKAGEWRYRSDTAILDKQLLDFFKVETDTVIKDINIYTENHLFINPHSALVERYERRLYHNGKEKQFIIYTFSDYDFHNDPLELTYSYPSHYVSKMASEKEKLHRLEAGLPAPEFELMDMEGRNINLSDLRGQKVLINFSMINCGWCKVALDNFNDEEFEFAEGITALYINPVDSKEDMAKYLKKFTVPFPVIPEAKSVGKSYGVSGYPTFYLINEKGVIENVISGYQEDFINSLRR